jgi:hypothetical protein
MPPLPDHTSESMFPLNYTRCCTSQHSFQKSSGCGSLCVLLRDD